MHFKNGREIKMGDPVIGVGNHIKGLIVGHVVGITPAQQPLGVGAPPTRDGIKVLTHLKSPDHKAADTATFNTVQEFGSPKNFVHAQDGMDALTPKPAETLVETKV